MNAHTHNEPAPARRVSLAPNVKKIIAAIGLIIKLAEARGRGATQYDIVKSLFLADRSHLNKFGRPITYDNYVAMFHGPVPSLAYDILKQNQNALLRYGISRLPWSSKPADYISKGTVLFTNSVVKDEEEVLSKSDIQAITDSLSIISSLTFGQVRKLAHDDIAYREAWRNGQSKNNPMSLGLFFDEPDFDAADRVDFVSHQQNELASVGDVDFDSYIAELTSGRDSSLFLDKAE